MKTFPHPQAIQTWTTTTPTTTPPPTYNNRTSTPTWSTYNSDENSFQTTTQLDLEDSASIDTFPLALPTINTTDLNNEHHQPLLDWQTINETIAQWHNRNQPNQNPDVADRILRATNYHWVSGLQEHPLAHTNYHWEALNQQHQRFSLNNNIQLDDISSISKNQDNTSIPSLEFDETSTISSLSFRKTNDSPHHDATGTTEIATAPILPNIPNLSIQDEVHRVVTGTSQKFVPQPSFDTVAIDAFQSLKRFATTVRIKEAYRNEQQQHRGEDASTNSSISIDSSMSNKSTDGLQTGLKPIRNAGVERGSNELEMFLQEVNQKVLDMVWAYRNNTTTNPISDDIHSLKELLKNNPDVVVVPTDKTNSFQVTSKQFYIDQVKQHLSQRAKIISHSGLQTIRQQGLKFLKQLQPHLSIKEYGYLSQSLQSCAVPTPKLAVKDHKKPDTNGNYPTRLIVPAQNFVAAFPKMGYMAIKKIFDDNKIDYKSNTIVQAADLKTELEKLNLQPHNCTIASLDAEAFYPSVRYKLVAKAVKYFSQHLSPTLQQTIEMCMQMIQFGMQSTYLIFQDNYYEYDGDQDPVNRGLTIGGFESAWLSDLVGAYIFLRTRVHFDGTKFKGIYRDDGLVVFDGTLTYDELLAWRNTFQMLVNEIAEGDYLQFTMEIWADQQVQPISHPPIDKNAPVQINSTPEFPYLDMELHWHNNQQLHFKVHLKPNQQLLYLNKGSCHTSACFNAIPLGVCHRLAKLTSVTEANADTSLRELYPAHFKALEHANLINKRTMPVIPTLREATTTYHPISPSVRALQQRQRDARRRTYFCIGYSKAWTTPIWSVIQQLINNRYPELKWIRPTMSYHRFTNLREIFSGDLVAKLNANVVCRDFTSRECNCRNRETSGCDYNNHCRDTIIVYEAKSNYSPNPFMAPKSYIGATQTTLKDRMQGHVGQAKQLQQYLQGTRQQKPRSTDTFARYFARIAIATNTNPTPASIRTLYTLHVLWHGNPLTTVKTFGTNYCILCNQEKLCLFKRMRTKPGRLINDCDELFGTCRHKPRFHRFAPASQVSSTDESSMDEKVPSIVDV